MDKKLKETLKIYMYATLFIILLFFLIPNAKGENWYLNKGQTSLNNFSSSTNQGFSYEYTNTSAVFYNMSVWSGGCGGGTGKPCWTESGASEINPAVGNRTDFAPFDNNNWLWFHPDTNQEAVIRFKPLISTSTNYTTNLSYYLNTGGATNLKVLKNSYTGTTYLNINQTTGTISHNFFNFTLDSGETLLIILNPLGSPSSDSSGIILNISSVENIIIPTYTYNISVRHTPNINNTIFKIFVEANINSTTNLTSNGYTELYYLANTTLNNGCSIYENNICTQKNNFTSINMTKINNSYFNISLLDTDIFPAYYPWYKTIDNINNRLNYSVYKNNYLLFQINNFTTNNNTGLFLSSEFMTYNTTGSSNLNIFYCNSSYINGNPLNTANCELLDSYNPVNAKLKHKHNVSNHDTIFFLINNVVKTPLSYIIFANEGNVNNAWKFSYIPFQTGYNNFSFKYGGTNFIYTNTSNIFDIHIHQFLDNDYFIYYAKYNNGTSERATSQTIIDFYNITQQPPNSVLIINPIANQKYVISAQQNTTIYFNWTNTSDTNNDEFTFKHLSFYNTLQKYDVISSTKNLYSNYTATNSTQTGDYYINISVCDNFACDFSETEYTFNICRNSYVKTTQLCVSNNRIIIYSDLNNCGILYDIPLDNGTYETCSNINLNIVKDYPVTDTNIYTILFLLLIIILIIILSDSVLLLFVAMVFNIIIYNAITTYYSALLGIVIIVIFVFLVLKIIYAIGKNKQ